VCNETRWLVSIDIKQDMLSRIVENEATSLRVLANIYERLDTYNLMTEMEYNNFPPN